MNDELDGTFTAKLDGRGAKLVAKHSEGLHPELRAILLKAQAQVGQSEGKDVLLIGLTQDESNRLNAFRGTDGDWRRFIDRLWEEEGLLVKMIMLKREPRPATVSTMGVGEACRIVKECSEGMIPEFRLTLLGAAMVRVEVSDSSRVLVIGMTKGQKKEAFNLWANNIECFANKVLHDEGLRVRFEEMPDPGTAAGGGDVERTAMQAAEHIREQDERTRLLKRANEIWLEICQSDKFDDSERTLLRWGKVEDFIIRDGELNEPMVRLPVNAWNDLVTVKSGTLWKARKMGIENYNLKDISFAVDRAPGKAAKVPKATAPGISPAVGSEEPRIRSSEIFGRLDEASNLLHRIAIASDLTPALSIILKEHAVGCFFDFGSGTPTLGISISVPLPFGTDSKHVEKYLSRIASRLEGREVKVWLRSNLAYEGTAKTLKALELGGAIWGRISRDFRWNSHERGELHKAIRASLSLDGVLDVDFEVKVSVNFTSAFLGRISELAKWNGIVKVNLFSVSDDGGRILSWSSQEGAASSIPNLSRPNSDEVPGEDSAPNPELKKREPSPQERWDAIVKWPMWMQIAADLLPTGVATHFIEGFLRVEFDYDVFHNMQRYDILKSLVHPIHGTEVKAVMAVCKPNQKLPDSVVVPKMELPEALRVVPPDDLAGPPGPADSSRAAGSGSVLQCR